MWMWENRGPLAAKNDPRFKLSFISGTNLVWGTLGVKRKGNEYIVIWEPIK